MHDHCGSWLSLKTFYGMASLKKNCEMAFKMVHFQGFPRTLAKFKHFQGLEKIIYHSRLFTAFNPYSAGIDFSRQNLTSVDIRF